MFFCPFWNDRWIRTTGTQSEYIEWCPRCNQKVTCFGGSSCGLNGSCNDCNQSTLSSHEAQRSTRKSWCTCNWSWNVRTFCILSSYWPQLGMWQINESGFEKCNSTSELLRKAKPCLTLCVPDQEMHWWIMLLLCTASSPAFPTSVSGAVFSTSSSAGCHKGTLQEIRWSVWTATEWEGSSVIHTDTHRRGKAERKRSQDNPRESQSRGVITCEECRKVRCIFTVKLTPSEALQIEHIKESKLFTCGSPLFPEESSVSNTVVAREAVTCAAPIEFQYYNSVLVRFPPVCYHCGLGEENLIDDDEIKELCTMYATVLPICFNL